MSLRFAGLCFLVCLAGYSCRQVSEAEVARGGSRAPSLPEALATAPPPAPPRAFRSMTLEPIPEAAERLREVLSSPTEIAYREELADIYERTGFAGAAGFFANTARVIRSEAPLAAPVLTPIAWSLYQNDLNGQAVQSAKEVHSLVVAGRHAEAVQQAQSAIEEHGLSLQLAVQWSDAVLWLAMVSRDEVSPDKLEVAIRIFLTSLTESTPRPVGVVEDADGYELLSSAFLQLEDLYSARTAVELALEHLKTTRVSGEWRAVARERLERRLEMLEARMGR